MKRQHIAITVTILAATGLVGGCSSEVAFPKGTYETTAEVNEQGKMTVIFGDDGIHTLMQRGALIESGTYTVSGDQITMTDPLCKNLSGSQETATYTWTWENSVLAMTTTDDACPGRTETLQELKPVK